MSDKKKIININDNLEKKIHILPLRDIVIFPHMIAPLFVGREKSVLALEDAMQNKIEDIVLVAQKDPANDDPKAKDLYSVGTLATLMQYIKLPDGTIKILAEGKKRVKIKNLTDSNGFFEADCTEITEIVKKSKEEEALLRTVISQFEQHVKLNKKIPLDVLNNISLIKEADKLSDTVASYFSFSITDKQKLLETPEVNKRLEIILGLIESENSILNVEKKIKNRVKKQMEKTQREYYLNEQLKAINKEMNETEDGDEFSEIEKKIKSLRLSKEAKEKANSELKKLKTMNSASAESGVIKNYLDWLLNLPWKKNSKIKNNLKEAEDILNQDHYGLGKVKERILEYLAVQSRVGKIKGQIICLVGPPGVGKTSLGKSIASATGRQFVRISLGGVKDESEIRGHRRTYIGSMPGRIIKGMKKAKTSNPLFLLDEIDKIGSDWRGDPASALLEVLDPEQNTTFNDHYLEVDYDLSNVMFVTTANTLKMPQPLLDRMEIIRLSGYTEDEKLSIVKKHLLPKQMKEHGLKKEELKISDDALIDVIRYYTKEAGVRNLEREIANIARKTVRQISLSQEKNISITKENLTKFSGIRKFSYGEAEKQDQVGTVTGLAWTEVGGEMLSIEAVIIPGKGKMLITGKLGDVMQESIQAALSYIRANSLKFGLNPDIFEKKDVHVHVPEGAIPKDGPSAGIGMCTAIVSAFCAIPVKKEVAMTGEVTLRGNVLAIGGLKEKLLAAHRGGIKTVIIPFENQKDLEDIPQNVKDGLKIIPVSNVSEVLNIALLNMPNPISSKDVVVSAKINQNDPSIIIQ